MTVFGELGISQNMVMLPQDFFAYTVASELNNMLCVLLLILNLSVYPLNLLIGSIVTSSQYK